MADSGRIPESFAKFDGTRSQWRLYHINLKALLGRFKLLTTLVLTAAAITDAVNAVKADKAKDEDLAILQNLSWQHKFEAAVHTL